MKAVTFGEIMLRLKTPEYLRIVQSNIFEASYGGAEANVTVSLATMGDQVSFVTKVPAGPVGQAAINEVRRFGVHTEKIVRGGERLGVYFFEKGTNIRPTNVVYDRKYSAMSQCDPADFDWEKVLEDTDIFYFSGVTAAISDVAAEAVKQALQHCRAHGIEVVCDLNYRGKLWSTEKAQKVMSDLMQYVTFCIANDEDFEATLGIPAYDGDMEHGIDQIDSYKAGMQEILNRYPSCKAVASVLRNLHSAEDGEWMGIYLKDGIYYESPIHTVHSLEAVGAGDAFAAGLLHAWMNGYAPQELIDYSIAASVLKLMIQRDFNVVTEADVRGVMNSAGTNLRR